MSIQYTMPEAARGDHAAHKPQQAYSNILFKPRPHVAGEMTTNELIIPLYQPDKWRLFNPNALDAQKYNMVEVNPLLSEGNEPVLYTFHMMVPTHKIDNFVRSDGTQGFINFVCPNQFNDYLVNVMGKKPLFKPGVCPFCKASSDAWSEHNARWEELKQTTGVDKSNLDKKGYLNFVDKDPILKDTREKARFTYGTSERYLFNVFDYGFLTGTVPLAEGENPVHQIWMAPKSVYTALNMYFEEDHKDGKPPFFMTDAPEGLQIMKIIKDTTDCSKGDLRATKYQTMKGSYVQPDPAWKEFITNLDAMADPSSILQVLSSDEMLPYVQSNRAINQALPEAPPVQSPAVPQQYAPPQAPPIVAPPVQAAPQAPVAPPVQAAPVAPPVQAAPVAPPVQAAPLAPVAPPVQAAPAAPPVQVAPSMTPPVPAMAPPSPVVEASAPAGDRTPPASDGQNRKW